MPVDPYIQAALQQMAAYPAPTSIQQMRAAEGSSLSAMPVRPVEIGGTRDLSIPGPASELPARLYTPVGEAPAAGWPLTVFYHGGGFAVGNIASHDGLCRELCAASGSAVLSVEYRLAPEFPFPAPTDDVYAAYLWAAAHAAELGADASRLAVAGDSAGANLSTVVTLRVRDEGGPTPRAQLLFYPAVDFVTETGSRRANGKGYFLTEDMMRMFGEAYITDPAHAAHPHASPLLSAQLHDLPPALVLTAEFDPLIDEGEGYYRALVAAGNRAEYVPGPGMVHGYANMTGFVPAAARLVDQGAAWLKRELA
ncbi:alpha/beta hydrolase [Deinococcus aquiradiocola]|uniref:Lipase n=1 Tax=Deinococcus aquiradiocola TaxID=393059 RepID=A0A917PLZ3_9DEIO|nr:alpha/beta hydrolase [Deinococcus aquiradiocola]GGJ83832.1 lipase [Deinococcus aquiradiocola]